MLYGPALLMVIGGVWWLVRILKAYRKGRKKPALLQFSVMVVFAGTMLWKLELFPLSKNLRIKEQTESLTGRSFWPWKKYAYEDWGFRGEGYELDMYSFDEETAAYFKSPDSAFYARDLNGAEWYKQSSSGWRHTPVDSSGLRFLEIATPDYSEWEGEILDHLDEVRRWGRTSGSLYAYRGNPGNIDFFLINPAERVIVMITHNP